MTTATQIISGALKLLGVRAAESPITAVELQDGLEALNDMGAEWEEDGIRIGFEPVTDATADLGIPRSSVSAFKANLAIRIAPEYSRIVSPALAKLGDDTMDALTKSVVFIGNVQYPGTLPLGSGNECDDFTDQRFFPQNTPENF
jgi:hypothetical protein